MEPLNLTFSMNYGIITIYNGYVIWLKYQQRTLKPSYLLLRVTV